MEGDGAVVAVFEVLEVVFAGALAGVDTAAEAGVEGAVDVVFSGMLDVDSFLSAVEDAAASLPGDGFSLSE